MCLAAAGVLSVSVLVVADDATTPPAATQPAAVTHAKLTKPWSELSNLTDDQKAKIAAVHAKALEDEKAIRDKEKEDIDAVLTDDQKKELKELEAKARRAARTAKADAPATQPAN